MNISFTGMKKSSLSGSCGKISSLKEQHLVENNSIKDSNEDFVIIQDLKLCNEDVQLFKEDIFSNEELNKSFKEEDKSFKEDELLKDVKLLKEELLKEEPLKVTRTCSDRSNANFINNIKCKISNASIFKYREESRAAKISILVIFMVLICYVPYGASLIFDDYTTKSYHNVSIILLITSNVISPFLFAYRNRRVQRELYKFFGIKSNKLIYNSSKNYCRTSLLKKRIENANKEEEDKTQEPFINNRNENIPKVIITCKVDNEKKSILKRVCSTNWQNYSKCNFITVPDSCVNGEARGSFSSASTQISNDE